MYLLQQGEHMEFERSRPRTVALAINQSLGILRV